MRKVLTIAHSNAIVLGGKLLQTCRKTDSLNKSEDMNVATSWIPAPIARCIQVSIHLAFRGVLLSSCVRKKGKGLYMLLDLVEFIDPLLQDKVLYLNEGSENPDPHLTLT